MTETGPQSQPDDALVDLLVKQVTEGLSPDEQRALDVLDSAVSAAYLHDIERAAGAISVAAFKAAEAPPPALQARLQQAAQAYMASAEAANSGRGSGAPAADNVLKFESPKVPEAGMTRRRSRSGALGWMAAAACLLLAVFGWFRSPPPAAPVAEVQAPPPPVVAPPVQAPVAPPTPAQERAAMLARTGTVKVTLAATKDPAAAGVTGDVVWDPAAQKGYLHFVGLASNDPAVRQYQVWIFDGRRDKRYPVDGGVFDVPADSSEVVIPIHAELPISLAKAFAVTSEKPGGVVVSALGHVIAMGAAG